MVVGSLEERIADIRARYINYVARPDFEDIVRTCHKIEKEIQNNLDISVDEITNEAVEIEIEKNKVV